MMILTTTHKKENMTMTFLTDVLHNPILMSAIIGWFIAQVLKTIIHLIMTRQFVAERLVGSGGMQSCHSSTVCALTTATGIIYGVSGYEFAIACILAIIVMYDAMGVRRAAGKQAKVLNEMMDLFHHMGKKLSAQDTLKEFIGHTPIQVFAGAILGIFIAIIVCNFMI